MRKKRQKRNHFFRFNIFDEESLNEIWQIRFTKSQIIVSAVTLFILLSVVVPYLFFSVPFIRKLLLVDDPRSVNVELNIQRDRIDSLDFELTLFQQYNDIIKNVLSNNIPIDSIPSSDSLKIILQEEILLHRDSNVSAFLKNYESKQSSSMQPIGLLPDPSIPSFFVPAHGKVIPYKNNYVNGVSVKTGDNANVYATLRGTVVSVSQLANLTFGLVIQHETYVSVYRNLVKVFPKDGEQVHSGEVIGFLDKFQPLQFELWQGGKNLVPQDFIAF